MAIDLSSSAVCDNLCTSCNVEMFKDFESATLICPICDKIIKLDINDCRSRTGTYDPTRHYRFWIDHILAKECDEEIGNKNDPKDVHGEKLIAIIYVRIIISFVY